MGNPGCPVAAVERGKEVLVTLNRKLFVSDHDFTTLSLIPSVTLHVDIPETIDGSFYRGDVHVGIKEHAFQPSSSIRHATELKAILSQSVETKPVLLLYMYTDGGPDHNVTNISVKVSLIALFLSLD